MELEIKKGAAIKLPNGYKQTEVGLIPEDWSLFSFDDIFSFNSTSNYSKAEMSDDNEVGCIHYGLIHGIPNSQYNLENGIKYYVSKEQAKYEFVRDGDVIMVDASEDLEGLNKSVEIKGVGDNKFISGLHTYLLRDKKSLLVDNFRGLVLNSKIVKNQMLQLAVGMKVFGVSKSQIVNVKIPLPPTLEEQKAIATALSDVDDLISSLNALIAKKKAIKQGAMQQLLTPPHKGGKRLDGFDGEWEETNLGSLCTIFGRIGFRGYTVNDIVKEGQGAITLSPSNIVNGQLKLSKVTYLSWFKYEESPEIKIYNNDILLVKTGSTFGKTALVRGLKQKATLNPQVIVLKKVKCNNVFLGYIMGFPIIQNQINSTVVGGAIPTLSQEQVSRFKLFVPPTIEEQNAIASTLSDMDKELEELASKKEKYEHIKQAMMQELLTGKTRLV
ncbi:restriction endonuclease subunit S [Cellulophaga baltica]|uniref:restriction endonuclease subunit S n=1 Tax=Cellulophaga baltica TaxID=76594 RepID=UPI0015F564D8|nr:restriction endonuclease subunit S [Cellulophaga baltica]MBA6315168.1 hypothetical protein [Cellulophaga baltica]